MVPVIQEMRYRVSLCYIINYYEKKSKHKGVVVDFLIYVLINYIKREKIFCEEIILQLLIATGKSFKQFYTIILYIFFSMNICNSHIITHTFLYTSLKINTNILE